ncbi:unnamed protein product [marine sediment metagenome]|uniref:Uncharacterized protein n=1 Tax=marine sediment metagenome TaxID=412755 RepID=X1NBV6_9ZZZZ
MPEEDNKTKVTGGVRGGVYWEAGMAYGMGKTVIQTCIATEESKRRIHFDLNQYRTIFWRKLKSLWLLLPKKEAADGFHDEHLQMMPVPEYLQ